MFAMKNPIFNRNGNIYIVELVALKQKHRSGRLFHRHNITT